MRYRCKLCGRNKFTKPTPHNADGSGHPAAYPFELAVKHIQTWSNPGDIVLDPFSGSGTTCKAAKELGRQYIGFEINPAYVEIGERRTAQEVLSFATV